MTSSPPANIFFSTPLCLLCSTTKHSALAAFSPPTTTDSRRIGGSRRWPREPLAGVQQRPQTPKSESLSKGNSHTNKRARQQLDSSLQLLVALNFSADLVQKQRGSFSTVTYSTTFFFLCPVMFTVEFVYCLLYVYVSCVICLIKIIESNATN